MQSCAVYKHAQIMVKKRLYLSKNQSEIIDIEPNYNECKSHWGSHLTVNVMEIEVLSRLVESDKQPIFQGLYYKGIE